MRIKTGRIFLHLFFIIVSVIWLIPTLGLAVASIRPMAEIVAGWWNFSPLTLTLKNYGTVLAKKGMARYFLNSIIITVPSSIIPIFFASLAAYGFAWSKFRWKNLIFLGCIAMMIVPLQMVLVPLLKLLKFLGFLNTYIGIILVHSSFGLPFAIFLLRNFFVSIPPELIDAAKIDGCSEFRIYWKMILPLSGAALASLAIFQFVWVWNSLLFELVFLKTQEIQPLTVGLINLKSRYLPEWNLLSAGSLISLIMPLIIFLLLQKYFVKGILAGMGK